MTDRYMQDDTILFAGTWPCKLAYPQHPCDVAPLTHECHAALDLHSVKTSDIGRPGVRSIIGNDRTTT